MCVFAIFSPLSTAFRHSLSHNFSHWDVIQTLVIGVFMPLQKYCKKTMRCDWFHVCNVHFNSCICSKLNENFLFAFHFIPTLLSLWQKQAYASILKYRFITFSCVRCNVFYSWWIDEPRDPLLNLYTSLHRKKNVPVLNQNKVEL